MKLAKGIGVKIVVLGAGGTGGYVIPHLYRIAHASNRPCRIIIADGDVTERKNLIRQNFAPCDIGENKARVLAERYAAVYGMQTEYIPEFIEEEEWLFNLLMPKYTRNGLREIGILIGAVDNNRSRMMCHRVFERITDLIYIDSGNGAYTGQVICGAKRGNRTILKPVAQIYPDVLRDTEKFPSELSCAERSLSAPQTIAANVFAAAAVASMLYYLLIEGELKTGRISFSARRLMMKAIA